MAKKRAVKRKTARSKKTVSKPVTSIHVITKARLDPISAGYMLAILFGSMMFVLSILGKMGLALEAVAVMQKFHLNYSLSLGGIISGIAEAAICGIIVGIAAGWLYNKLL